MPNRRAVGERAGVYYFKIGAPYYFGEVVAVAEHPFAQLFDIAEIYFTEASRIVETESGKFGEPRRYSNRSERGILETAFGQGFEQRAVV